MKYVLDTHCHTVASGHAYSTVQENAKEAANKGLELIAITDHAATLPGGAHLFHFHNLIVIPKKIYGVEILRGAEVNILDFEGHVDLEEETLENLDMVIASFHPPCIKPGSIQENTNALIKVMQNPHIDIIGHPGDPRYPIDIKAVVEAAKEYGTLLEINNSSLKPDSFRAGGSDTVRAIINECIRMDMPFVFGSDAHISYEVGNFEHIEKLIEGMEIPEHLIVNTSVALLKGFLA
ncbi:MAG: putative hydrolase [Epulopiscium sp.]|jgi:putative hydrolase|uniref:PHP domain-containing protein n=1 Tax=Defluviitalea raffinosedens TaxID=1450156 RepID=A0A7C8LGW9_9FIRM|nr:phosphatase [Defluviitalea raffinosedens]MBZ4669271.1 phosphatase [Defluviitaleaceae bacterium]MDK2789359.1 putative hydrolase [Candidatus Epulonipiscium sp.]KAE9631381.1 PHP domain-containing protein [Defluviitalea raffinosedens]MBM7684848.1 putative hydrolase [Defluviitalea raffinosedens]HHW67083.1 phosphatase [Candidatus Epulonipiscium sp.]